MENYQYIKVPNSISLQDYIDNDFCLAPSKYSRFLPNNNVNFESLANLCSESIKKLKITTKQKYNYSEIGDISVSDGSIASTVYYGLNIPSENPKEILENDILISTVRTYRGGVGFIYERKSNHCSTPAVLVIREVNPIITKEYLVAVLRTDFFIEQILGFQNRGMYPRLDKDAMNHILIPIPKKVEVISFITVLVKAYYKKIALIKERHEAILKNIETELLNNQKPNQFSFKLPRINELKEVGRLDTGLYNIDFKRLDFLISNYSKGFSLLKDLKYKPLRGPNLANSIIGITYYSTKRISEKFYKLIQPTDLSDFGTLETERYFGNIKDISLLKKGDILFAAEGNIGKVYVNIDIKEKSVTNFHGISINNQSVELYNKCFIACFLKWLRHKNYFNYYSTGGQGGSFGVEKIEIIKVPNFTETKQKEIAKLYHNEELEYKTDIFTLSNFLDKDNEYNQQAGIYELDKTAKQLKKILNQTIDNIVNDKEIEITFHI